MHELKFSALACNRINEGLDIDHDSELVAFAGSNLIGIKRPQDEFLRTLKGQHSMRLTALKIMKLNESKKTFIIVGSVDKTITVWEITENEYIPTHLKGHEFGIVSIGVFQFSNEFMFASSDSGSNIKIWKLVEGEILCIQTLSIKPHQAMALTLSYLPDTNTPILLVGGTDLKLHVYIHKSGEFVKQLSLEGHTDWIRSIKVATYTCTDQNTKAGYRKGDLMIASASQDKYIRIWRCSLVVEGDESDSNAQVLDELQMVDGTLKLSTKSHLFYSDEKQYSMLLDAVLMGHDGWVLSINWQPATTIFNNGIEELHQPMRLISASADKSLICWEPDSHSESWVPKDRVGEVGGSTLGFYGAILTRDGNRIYSNGYNGAIHVWQKSTNSSNHLVWNPVVGISGHSNSVEQLQWDPTGSYLISTSLDQTSRIFSTWKTPSKLSWHEIGRSQIHGYNLNAIAFTSKYQYISGADEKVIRVFDAPRTFALSLQSLGGIADPPAVLDQRPTGANLPALGLSNKAVFEGDGNPTLDKTNMEYSSRPGMDNSEPLKQPPFEEHLLQNTLWPETEKLYGHVYEIIALAANPKGTLFASSSKAAKAEHATVRLWSTEKWIEVCKPLEFHSLTVTTIKFSNSGQYLLTAGRDRGWAIFDIHDIEKSGNWTILHSSQKAHSRIIWTCGFSHDDKYFFTGSRDKSVFFCLNKVKDLGIW